METLINIENPLFSNRKSCQMQISTKNKFQVVIEISVRSLISDVNNYHMWF